MKNLVYRIINKNTGNFYIGSSKNHKKRFDEHWNDLRMNKHHCYPLQQLFNLYGEDSFHIEILKTCNKLNEARELEDLILQTNDTLNISMSAYHPDTFRDEIFRQKVAKRMKGNTFNINRKASQETKDKMTDTRTGRKQSETTKKKVALSKEKKIRQFTLDGKFIKEFKSVKEAAEKLNRIPQNISKCLSGAQKTAYGFTWKYTEKNKVIINTKTGRKFETLNECAEYYGENINNMSAYLYDNRVNNKYSFLKFKEIN